MKHNLRTLGITDHNQYLSARGAILSGHPWKGLKLSPEEAAKLIESLDEEVSAKGWDSPENSSQVGNIGLDDNLYDLTDFGVAQYYVMKCETSRKRNILFELSLSEFKRIVRRKRCHYTGETLTRGDKHARNAFTLDRVDSSKGYTKDNTVPCANWVNTLKNELFENKGSKLLTDVHTLGKILTKLK